MNVAELEIPMQLKELILQSGIAELFPPQEEAIRAGALEGKNLVLASPTASGKTLVAELCCLKHVLEKNDKAIYLAPLRALASEKFDDFQKYTRLKKNNGQNVNVGISTGDFDSGDPWMGKHDIIVTSVDYEEPIVTKENNLLRIEKIGVLIDNLMNNKDKVQNTSGTEILEISDMNLQAAAFDWLNLKINFKKITQVVRHKTNKRLCRITLQTGRNTTVTENHSIYVLEGLEVVTKDASDIKTGDLVLIPKSLPSNQVLANEIDLLEEFSKFENSNLYLKNIDPNFFESALFTNLKTEESDKINWKKRRELPFEKVAEGGLGNLLNSRVFFSYLGSRHKVPTKIPTCSELARLIGYYIAEGSIDEINNRISLAFGYKDTEYVKDACNCTETLFNFKPVVTHKNKAIYVDICDKIVCLFFSNILKLARGAKKKRVPSIIFNMNPDLQHEFIKALTAGDGVFEPRLALVTASKDLASDFLYLLLQSEVTGGIYHTKGKRQLPSGKIVDAENYKAYVTALSHLQKLKMESPLCSNIRFPQNSRVCMIPTKSISRILTTFCRLNSNGSLVQFGKRTSRPRFMNWLNKNEIRVKIELLQLLKKSSFTSAQLTRKIGINWYTLNSRLRSLLKKGLIERKGKSGYYSYDLSKRGLDILEEMERAKTLFNSDLAFAKVTKIEKVQPSNAYVYDVSVPFCENFVAGAGGVICHNTNEKADSLLRHRARWMDEISLVIADEVHLLNEAERGPTLEVVLARLMEVNPNIQVLALSATMGNVDEIAAWLKAQHVITEWRPVNLKEGVLLHDEIQFKDGDARKIERRTSNDAVNLAWNTVKTRGQALIFASTRKNAASLAKKIADQTGKELSKFAKKALEHEAERIRTADEKTRLSETLADLVTCGAAFHHAGLASAHRKIIEDLFRQGRIKVLTATPTLAFGMNLPARCVIVQDYRRYEAGYGYYPISVLDYKQMAGRAGRPKYDKNGEAILIAKNADEQDYLMENFVLARPERIWSRLAVEKILRGHVLATVASDFAHTERGVYEFFGKTFYAYQYGMRAIEAVIAKILKYLHDEQLLYLDKENLYASKLGKRTSELYLDPVSAVIIREALKQKPEWVTELSLLHLITHTPDMGPVMRPYGEEIEMIAIQAEQHQEELFISPPNEWDDQIAFQEYLGELKTAMILNAWIEETSEDQLMEKYRVQPGDLYRIIENGKWLLHATQELAELFKEKELLSFIREVNERVAKGIKKELLPIVKLEGIGRTRGRILFNAGYRSVEDVRHATLNELTNLPAIGPRLAKKIKGQVGGFVKKEEWEKLENGEEWKQKALSDF